MSVLPPLRVRLLHSNLLLHEPLRRKPLAVVVVDIRAWHVRRQSTTPGDDDASHSSGGARPRPPPPPPPPRGRLPFVRLLFRAMAGSLRSIFTPFRGQTLRTLYRQNPGELVLALIVLVACACVVAYVVRIYFTYFNSRQFTRYPPPVAKHLRRALYFGTYAPDPKRALKNYKLALEQCDLLGLDPFSDDVLGIRIQLAAWLEQIHNYEAAVKILELLLADCRRWVDEVDAGVRVGTIKDGRSGGGVAATDNAKTLSSRIPPLLLRGKANADGGGDDDDDEEASYAENLWGRRSRILRKAIGISVKLGELYADEHVRETDLAHERLVWSVDTALGEFRRRSIDGVKEGEGEWMSPTEMGATLESLGHNYESRSQFQLALPLFFQALRLCSDPCHSAVIMNNLAVSFAQHPLQPPYQTLVGSVMEKKPGGAPPPTKKEARAAYLETAQRWATNAHQHATATTGDARTPECNEACVVALCNLGDIAAMLGRVDEARRRFQEGRAMGEKFAFAAGVQQADAGLSRLPPR
ncbi:tpr domain containing protein [Niveomyces insectorum RCEF 264]|uniref:Tpr domain containing protein n=1 Tax=Niveomyces insectorum RCEF 264 TaxID=1081102 RepID=A0A167ZWH5_9HYPO|nr:tpr domain containing protein [Niveomyces insectorum RCEF 264]